MRCCSCARCRADARVPYSSRTTALTLPSPLQAKYKKSFANAEEEERHHQNFLAALKHVESHNQKRARGEVSYSIGINQFSDQVRETLCAPLPRLRVFAAL